MTWSFAGALIGALLFWLLLEVISPALIDLTYQNLFGPDPKAVRVPRAGEEGEVHVGG